MKFTILLSMLTLAIRSKGGKVGGQYHFCYPNLNNVGHKPWPKKVCYVCFVVNLYLRAWLSKGKTQALPLMSADLPLMALGFYLVRRSPVKAILSAIIERCIRCSNDI